MFRKRLSFVVEIRINMTDQPADYYRKGEIMEESELKPCWRCGKKDEVHFVSSAGIRIDDNRGLVSCFTKSWNKHCMRWNDIYSVQEWQDHSRDQ
jgi:hypothetical protein